MEPSLILFCIYPRMNVVISGVQAEAWGSLQMVVSSTWGDHRGPVWAVIPFSIYNYKRYVDGCLTPSGRLSSVLHFLGA